MVFGCNMSNNNSGNAEFDVDTSDFQYQEQSHKVKKIFYNVPSPIEMAAIMQRAGASYDFGLLNRVENVDKYTTNSTMALNLGVYGADLSYTRMFDQIQESVNFLSVIRKLSDGLGIPQEPGRFAVSRIEKNIENRDSLLLIITDVYGAADIYLKENNRGSTATLIILGGWVEALYIATNIINENKKNTEVLERIAEQKYSLQNLIELLNSYEGDEIIALYLPTLNELDEIYKAVEITSSKTEVKTDSIKKITSIDNKSEIKITMKEVQVIREKVSLLREKIIK
ncbi:MAG: hypothetical protein A2W98_00920 [Bacteroidetes bacterium GWF2_33_38]|nr:MAG: hypothetical protein A2W98_00920 [Bacteroidetes bacterium GWF2_33_38]OFY72639.1 MAG: hypothetical protein A2265_06925 [Bacteroidetes bacterium RIFOXYA12_FULL_33_9]OFY92360.1 MAG: hypothetical protein A2236_00910 [Bacteroidetes bacterium RIFOXYA2_FULL_33_7]